MTEKYYLDACIWIDYFENRSDKFRPLGEWALQLINKIICENGIFVLSDHLMNELRVKYSSEEITRSLAILPEALTIKTGTNRKQALDASKLKEKLQIPFGDALHAILAKDNEAILVSRDKHFLELGKLVIVRKPEELL